MFNRGNSYSSFSTTTDASGGFSVNYPYYVFPGAQVLLGAFSSSTQPGYGFEGGGSTASKPRSSRSDPVRTPDTTSRCRPRVGLRNRHRDWDGNPIAGAYSSLSHVVSVYNLGTLLGAGGFLWCLHLGAVRPGRFTVTPARRAGATTSTRRLPASPKSGRARSRDLEVVRPRREGIRDGDEAGGSPDASPVGWTLYNSACSWPGARAGTRPVSTLLRCSSGNLPPQLQPCERPAYASAWYGGGRTALLPGP